MLKYKPGQRLKMLFTGKEGTILELTNDRIGGDRYRIRFDDGHEMRISEKDAAPPRHPIHEYIAKQKREMVALGYNCLIVGKCKAGRIHAVIFKSYKHKEEACASIPDVEWVHYWQLK